jgi:methyltransferase (TIGR00027 family)
MIATTINQTNQTALDFSDVESTSLLTLYSRAIESRSENPILEDPSAERLVDEIDRQIAGSEDSFLKMLYEKDIDPKLVVHAALRADKYDRYAQEFLSRYPGGVIVNMGCGMDTRFQRIDDGKVHLFDLDLPEVIALKRRLLTETNRYRMIAASVYDRDWIDAVADASDDPVLFIAEGLFMYLEPDKVRNLILELHSRFPRSELVCELVKQNWVEGWRGEMTAVKMQRQLKLGEGTRYRFGVDTPEEIAEWHPGIEFLDQWSYFDSNHPKLGWMRYFRNLELFRGIQYTARYRFNEIS